LFDNFKLFRKSVYELALKLDDKSLLAYSNELSVLIEHFDIEGIENYLNEFEEKLGGLFKDE